MARLGIFKNYKTKLITVLALVAVMCFSLFAIACNEESDKTSTTPPSYSHTEVDDGVISNPNFSLGTTNVSFTAFPKTDTTGWSKTKDSDDDIVQAAANSGVIDVSSDAWKELMNNMYTDNAILSYVLHQNGITKDQVIENIKKDPAYNLNNSESYKPSDATVKEYIVNNYISKEFANPGIPSGAEDNAVFMLNNYRASSNIGLGTSQKITSSSKIILEKGTYGKFNVWVKVANLTAKNQDFGATIRLSTIFNAVSQPEYVIKNIKNTEWTKYTIYVQADTFFDTELQLVLGLGYQLNGLTQGTAYFDNVSFEEITQSEYTSGTNSCPTSTFTYAQEEREPVIASGTTYAFSLKLNDNYLKNSSATLKHNFTTSNTGSTADRFSDSSYTVSNASSDSPYGSKASVSKVSIKNSAATLVYDSFAKVDCSGYALVSFYVKNQLSKLSNTNVSFSIYDMLSGCKDIAYLDSASVTEVSDEWQHVSFVLKNNFEKDNDNSTTGDVARSFRIEVSVGPADVANVSYKDEFATGDVYITSPLVAYGDYHITADDAKKANDLADYNNFILYSSDSSSTISLFAGMKEDYSQETEHNHYSFSVAPSDLGSIVTHPAVASGYQGIVADHIYVKEGIALETAVNDRTNGNNDGSYAGLINTKYNYSSKLPGLASALNFKATEDEKNIQPLVIYNAKADNYGFISDSYDISASSFAHISVTLRVSGDDTRASVYLVDTSSQNKGVASLSNFTDTEGKEHTTADTKMQLFLYERHMGNDGWVTIDFFVATGASVKDLRVEVWNGTRDKSISSQGYVFIKNISVSTNNGFTESARYEDVFTTTDNPLYKEQIVNGEKIDEVITYTRQLSYIEQKFNNDTTTTGANVSYKKNIVWAKNSTMVYAIFNTIDPVETNPYDNEPEKEVAEQGNCSAETDPATFWMSFSSILLSAVLVLAIIMLAVKTFLRRRKANASDAKSHYKITSRTKVSKAKKVKKVEIEDDEYEDESDAEEVEETAEENAEETETEEEKDSYVYGDVEVFGNEDEKKND